ncbi:MAG: hypothetical protein A2021_06040 [Elusimicrobia bacterium GWF2_52_66]|nr:MAG: hypothetical protein A2021_06040 [Elusimicrobia bacterium GWF2_52_66]
MLGYLIAHDPDQWKTIFLLAKPISSVKIEADYERDRADILIEASGEQIVVEAKVAWVDPKAQVEKYDAKRKYLFTNYIPSLGQASSNIKYVSWEKVAKFLELLAANTGKPYVRHLTKELILYMKEHQLIRSNDSIEIYARELNDELTVSTFLTCHIYGCWLEKGGGTISRALYFAPHFGQKIASEHPGIYSGISYLAKIKGIEVVDTWASFIAAAKRQRGGWWWKKHKNILSELRPHWGSWNERSQRSIAFLGTPRLVFNPPINKDLLQKGKGFLSRRTFAFDELFEAWSKSSSARIR